MLLGWMSVLAGAVWADHESIDVFRTGSAEDALVLSGDFEDVFPMFETFCQPAAGECLFSTTDPGITAPEEDRGDGERALEPGTVVWMEMVAMDAGLAVNVNGVRLTAAGAAARLGVAPFHVHPSWQAVLPAGQSGEVAFSYRLITGDGRYAPSPVRTSRFVLVRAEPTPTPIPHAPDCAGDCDGNGEVTIDEILRAVALALGLHAESCGAADGNGDGEITIEEIVKAVQMALLACPHHQEVRWSELWQELFLPRCALKGCHTEQDHVGNLDLEVHAYESLVNVPPDNFAAATNGWRRVAPGDPEQSFLYLKLRPIAPQFGSQMPLVGAPVEEDWLQRIRVWILQGAPQN